MIKAFAAGVLAAGLAFSTRAETAEPVPARDGDGPLVVALDAGHGGRDPGAMVDGLAEKTLTLAFARDLAAAFSRAPGLAAVLTRADDSFVALPERIDRARRAGADLLISLHADRLAEGGAEGRMGGLTDSRAEGNGGVEGIGVYSLGPPEGGAAFDAAGLVRSRARGHLLAGSTLHGESDALAETLVGLARRDTLPASEALARALVAALDGTVAVLDKRPHRHGAFAVLKAADLPAVLVELGFMDNPRDRLRLNSPEWRRRATGAIIRAVRAWDGERRAAARAPAGGQMHGRNSSAGETAVTAERGTNTRRDTFAEQHPKTISADPAR